MNRIVRASAASGVTAVVLFFVIVGTRGAGLLDVSLNLVAGVVVAAAFLWTVGALFAALLLVPLKPSQITVILRYH